MNNQISFDAMVQMTAREAVYRELASFPSKKELEKMYATSKEHDRKMKRAINKEKRIEALKHFNKQFSKVAVVLLITFTVTFTPLFTAKAVRESIVQTIIEWRDEFARIFVQSDIVQAPINNVEIGYMPDGFELVGEPTYDTNFYRCMYSNGDSSIIIRIYSNSDYYITDADNEFSNYYSINIDGNDGIWVYQIDYNIIIISKDSFSYQIESNVDIGKLIEIFKNIEIS